MPDTVRTRAELIALLADNVTGGISPQDLRDFLATALLVNEDLLPLTDDTYDVGSAAKRWSEVYISDKLQIGAQPGFNALGAIRLPLVTPGAIQWSDGATDMWMYIDGTEMDVVSSDASHQVKMGLYTGIIGQSVTQRVALAANGDESGKIGIYSNDTSERVEFGYTAANEGYLRVAGNNNRLNCEYSSDLTKLQLRNDTPDSMFKVEQETVSGIVNVQLGDFGLPLNLQVYGTVNSSLKKTYKFMYDFATDGGGVAAIALRQFDQGIPDNFIVHSAQFDVIAAVTGAAGATAALGTGEGADDLVTATLTAGAPWSTTGLKPTTVLMGTSTTAIKMSAIRTPVITGAVNGGITGGTFNLYIEGWQSE